MTVETKRAIKYLEKFSNQEFDNDRQIVFLTDSKGTHLKRQQKYLNIRHGSVTWFNVGSRQSLTGLEFITNEIDKLSKKYTAITIIFWHGTCDVSRKIARHIFPRYANTEQAAGPAREIFDKLDSLISSYGNIKIYYLEIPPISIRKWNKRKEYEHWVAQSDDTINDHVRSYNSVVREHNLKTGFVSPKFEQDLTRSRKKKSQATKYSLNFNILYDGVHPSGIIAKYWLLRVFQAIEKSR
ncbi:MAG: hypothetical protein ABW168_25265 [Sedimenticola sp.]